MVNPEDVASEITPQFSQRRDPPVPQPSDPLDHPVPSDGDRTGPEEPWDEKLGLPDQDVALASMLMLGAQPWQRIDGMGMARHALEAPLTGDQRRDMTDQERFLLANGRAWCLLVFGDLGHQGRKDDPFVLADAERHVALGERLSPRHPRIATTKSLLSLRQGANAQALKGAREVIDRLGVWPEHDRNAETQGVALLAILVLALAEQAVGNDAGAGLLAKAVQAVRTSFEVDATALASLLGELRKPEDPAPRRV
jgi:hypothetical protein